LWQTQAAQQRVLLGRVLPGVEEEVTVTLVLCGGPALCSLNFLGGVGMRETVNGWDIEQAWFMSDRVNGKWFVAKGSEDGALYLHKDGRVLGSTLGVGGVTAGYFDTREEAVAAAKNYKGD
jgi:hypothetical protein